MCGHYFADLSEHKYGVTLMNDSKYGYTIIDNVMSLTLLRAPKKPDRTADMGEHCFKFAIYPHREAFPGEIYIYIYIYIYINIIIVM